MLALLMLLQASVIFSQQGSHAVSSGDSLSLPKGTAGGFAHHVVIQLNSGDTAAWRGMLNNIQHLKETWGNSVIIEVVTHGAGVEILTKERTTQWQRLTDFMHSGVSFVVCMNTMKGRNLSKEAFIPGAGFVPSGIVEVVLKQEQGYSYLKAGF